MRYVILILLISLPTCIFAQISGVVVDRKTGNPVEFANIWVENQNIGATSNEKGLFSFKENIVNKSLIISAIGYESLQIVVDKNNLRIELVPKNYLIEEVTVRPKKHNVLVVDIFRKSSVSYYLLSNSRPWIIAKFFKYSSTYEKTPFIKNLSILTDGEINGATFNLRLMSVNENGEPSGDILKENLIIKAKKGKRKLLVDLSAFQVTFPKNGFFVAVEALIIESNRREFVYTIEGSSKKIYTVQHDPKFGMVLRDDSVSNWIYTAGKWTDRSLKVKSEDKNRELAIELTLTD